MPLIHGGCAVSLSGAGGARAPADQEAGGRARHRGTGRGETMKIIGGTDKDKEDEEALSHLEWRFFLRQGDFTEGHELDRKWKVAKEMVGRRLSQEEAKRLLAGFG